MQTLRALLIGFAAVFVFATVCAAQNAFDDANVPFTFELPNAKWKLTVKPTAASPRVEFVYGDRRDGLFEVRQRSVAKEETLTEAIRDDEQKQLYFLPGYVAGRSENFAGRLRGTVANFEYVAAGKNMAGRHYYLRADDANVYVLRFSGPRDTLRGLRTQTDQIARSFSVK